MDKEEMEWWSIKLANSGLAKRRERINGKYDDYHPMADELLIRMRIAAQTGTDPVAGALSVSIVSGSPIIPYASISGALKRAGYSWTITAESEWSIAIDLVDPNGVVHPVAVTEQDFIDAGDLLPNGEPARHKGYQGKQGAMKVAPAVRAGVRMGRVIRKAYSRFGTEALSNLAVLDSSEASIVREQQARLEHVTPAAPVSPEKATVSVTEGHAEPSEPEVMPVEPKPNSPAQENWLKTVEFKLGEEPFSDVAERIKSLVSRKSGVPWGNTPVASLEKLATWMSDDPEAVVKAARATRS